MKAAVFEGPKQIRFADVEIPFPKSGEVRIKLEGCGLCGSNMPVWEGRDWFKYPLEYGSPGHEGWGIIDLLGDNAGDLKIGDRVAALSYHAFAEYDTAKASEVIKLPAELSEKSFPGEPLACTMNIFKRADIQKGFTVAVIGIGFLGAMLTQLAKNTGAKVIAISRRKFSLETAKEFNADELIEMKDHYEIINRVKEITNGALCDRVIEAAGLQWPLDLAGELVKEGGKLIIAGYHQDGPRQVNMQMWNWKGIDVINAHERDPQVYISGMKQAADAAVNGTLNPFPLFTHCYPFSRIEDAFKTAEERPAGFIKAIVKFT